MKLDAHQHFWQYDPVKDAWITDDMKALRRDFMPEHLQPILLQQGLDGCIAVQADQSEQETFFLLELADKFSFIKGVVGWIDLCAANISERLEYFLSFPLLKGFRHIVQAEPQVCGVFPTSLLSSITLQNHLSAKVFWLTGNSKCG
jgi:L-fuconolactonase